MYVNHKKLKSPANTVSVIYIVTVVAGQLELGAHAHGSVIGSLAVQQVHSTSAQNQDMMLSAAVMTCISNTFQL